MDSKDRKPHTVRVRLTSAQLTDLRNQAQAANKSVSELIRLRATHQPVLSHADATTADSIDQLGRLLKFLYHANCRLPCALRGNHSPASAGLSAFGNRR